MRKACNEQLYGANEDEDFKLFVTLYTLTFCNFLFNAFDLKRSEDSAVGIRGAYIFIPKD